MGQEACNLATHHWRLPTSHKATGSDIQAEQPAWKKRRSIVQRERKLQIFALLSQISQMGTNTRTIFAHPRNHTKYSKLWRPEMVGRSSRRASFSLQKKFHVHSLGMVWQDLGVVNMVGYNRLILRRANTSVQYLDICLYKPPGSLITLSTDFRTNFPFFSL